MQSISVVFVWNLRSQRSGWKTLLYAGARCTLPHSDAKCAKERAKKNNLLADFKRVLQSIVLWKDEKWQEQWEVLELQGIIILPEHTPI